MVRNAHAAASLQAFRTAARVAGHSAKYYRGDDYVELCVVPGRQDQLNQGRQEAAISGSYFNFEIEAACIEINDATITPTTGDRLVVDFGGEDREFVAVRGPNNRAWDWADNHQQIYTCHYSGRA